MALRVAAILLAISIVGAHRQQRAVPDNCNLPREPGPCRASLPRYFYNSQSAQCERFNYGGCLGNANHFTTEHACVLACERHADPPAQGERLKFADRSFCDRTCPLPCTCRGKRVECPGPLDAAPAGISSCTEELILSNSGIRMINPQAFSGMSSLKTLDLSGNDIRTLPEDAFSGLTSLEVLRLNDNKLQALPADVLQTAPNLMEVHLQNNHLQFVACETIDNLPNLRLVNVSNNRLVRLIPHPGTPLDQMTIDVSNNRLTTFSLPLSPDSSGPVLNLGENPWMCDCKLEQLITHYATRQQQVLDRNSALCANPSSQGGQRILLVNSEALECLPEDDTESVSEMCVKMPDQGPCRARIQRYYYDPQSQRCRQFTYGGCMGNGNNFATQEACQKKCIEVAGRPTGQPVREPPTDPGPVCNRQNEVYTDCGSPCESTCEEPAKTCFAVCVEACRCRPGTVRLEEDGPCVPRERCPQPAKPDQPTAGPRPTDSPLPAPVWPNPAYNVRDTTDDTVSLNLPRVNTSPGSTFDLEVLRDGTWQKIPDNIPVTRFTHDVSGLEPDTRYDFRIRYFDVSRNRLSPWSSPAPSRTDSAPETDPPTDPPTQGPFQPQWPTPSNNDDRTTDSRITVNLPGLPQLPSGSVLDVQYRRPGGNWSPAGTVSARNTPQEFDVPFLQPDTSYLFRFRYRSSNVPRGSPYSPIEQFRTEPTVTEPPPTEAPMPMPEWRRPASPSQRFIDLNLPSYTVPGSTFDVFIESDRVPRRLLFSQPTQFREQARRIPNLTPNTEYRFYIVARNGNRQSPESNVQEVRTLPERVTTLRPVPTQSPERNYVLSWFVSPQLEDLITGFRIQYRKLDPNGRPEPWVTESDNVPREDREYNLALPDSGTYELLVTGLTADGLPEIEQLFQEVIQWEGDGSVRPVTPMQVEPTTRPLPPTPAPTTRPAPTTQPKPDDVPVPDLAWPENTVQSVTDEEVTIRLPAAPPSTRLDVFEIVNRAYSRIETVPGTNSPQDLVFDRRPGTQRILFRIIDETGRATALSPVLEVTDRPIAPPTTMPPVVTTTATLSIEFPSDENPISVTSNSVTLRFPGRTVTEDISYELFNVLPNGQFTLLQSIPSTTQDQDVPITAQPGITYTYVSRVVNTRTNRAGRLSRRLTVTTPSAAAQTPAPQPTTAPAPEQPPRRNWPTPGYSEESTTPTSTVIFLPGLPSAPSGTTFNVEVRGPNGQWQRFASRIPSSDRPQQFRVSSLEPGTPYDFRFQYSYPTGPASDYSNTQTIDTDSPQPTGGPAPVSAPYWPSNQPTSQSPGQLEFTLPAAVPNYHYEVVRILPNGDEEVVGRYRPIDSRQQIITPVLPGENYRLGLRSRSISSPGQVSDIRSIITFQIPQAQPVPFPQNGVIQFQPSFPGQSGWVIRSNVDGEITRLPASTRQYTLDTSSLSVGTHTVTVETDDGRVIGRYIVIVRVPVPSWPGRPTFQSPDRVQLTLPAATPNYLYEVVRILPNGNEEVVGRYRPGDSRQQTIRVVPGENYRLGLRSRSTQSPSQVSGIGSTVSFNIPEVQPTPAPTPARPTSPAWPRPPTIQSPDRVQLTLPAATPNYLYEVVRILPNGNEEVVGRYRPSDSRQQTIRVVPGENYRLGLRSRSIRSPSQVSGIGSTISFNIPQVRPTPAPTPARPTAPAWPRPPTIPSPGQLQFTLPAATPNYQYEVVRILPNGDEEVVGRYRPSDSRQQTISVVPGENYRLGLRSRSIQSPNLVSGIGSTISFNIPQAQPVPFPQNGVIQFQPSFPGQSAWVIRSNVDGEITRLPASTRQYTLDTSSLSVGTHTVTVETDDGRVIGRYIVIVRLPAPSWPRPPTIQSPGQLQFTLPAAVSNYQYEVVRILPNGDEEVVGRYRPSDSRQQTISVVPGQNYRLGLRSRSIQSPSQVSGIGSTISFNIPQAQPVPFPQNGVIQFQPSFPGQSAWVIRSNVDGEITRLPASTRQYTLDTSSLSVGTHTVTVETDDGRVIGRYIVIVRLPAPSWPRPPTIQSPGQLQFTLPAAVSNYQYEVVRILPNGDEEVVGRYRPSDSRQQTISVAPGQNYRLGLRSRSIQSPSQVSGIGSTISFNIPQAQSVPFPQNGVIQFQPSFPGQSAWVIRSNVDGEITRLPASTRQYTLDISSLSVGTHTVTVETDDGRVIGRYIVIVRVPVPSWPRPPTIQSPDRVQLTLPAGVSNYLYEVVRILPNGDEEVVGSYRSTDSRQQTLSVVPGQNYRLGLRSRSTQSPSQVSGIGSTISFSVPQAQPVPFPQNGVIQFRPSFPGQSAWVIRSNVDGEITRLPASTRQYTLDTSSLSVGTHTVTVETDDGRVIGRYIVIVRIPLPFWPRPPTIQSPDRVQLTLPAGVSNYLYEVVRILPNGDEVVVGRYQPSDNRQQTISVQPGESYRLGLRARSIGSPSQVSGIGSTVSFNIPAAVVPVPRPTWPRPNPTQVSSSSVSLTLPASVNGIVHEVYRVFPDGRRTRVGSYDASASRALTFPAEASTQYVWRVLARRVSDNAVSAMSSYLTVMTPGAAVEPPTVPTVPGRSGTIETGDLRATWQVNGEGGVNVGLSTDLQNRWMGFGISRNGFMTNSDMITGYINGDGQTVVEDRFAFGRIRPAVDSDSQVSNVQGRRQGGRDYISFTIPCNSPDPRDVPLEGRRSLLLAMGPVRGSLISYHSDGRSASPLVQIDCSAREPITLPSTIAPGGDNLIRILGDRGLITLPQASGNQQWVIESNVDGEIGRVASSSGQYLFRLSALSAGNHVISIKSESGQTFSQFNFQQQGQAPAPAPSPAATTSVVSVNVDLPQELSGSTGQDQHWIVDIRESLRDGNWSSFQTIAVVETSRPSLSITLPTGNLYELSFRGKSNAMTVIKLQ